MFNTEVKTSFLMSYTLDKLKFVLLVVFLTSDLNLDMVPI